MDHEYNIFVINIGSTSTKLAQYRNERCLFNETIDHPRSEIERFPSILSQEEYRKAAVVNFMAEKGLKPEDFDAIVSRGGNTKPLRGGVYRVNHVMTEDLRRVKPGSHPCDLGPLIAQSLCEDAKAIPMVVDPPVTDELTPVARLSGHPLIERRASFHALSHRATAKKYARSVGRPYEDLNLVTMHMGGGITVAAHEKGLMVDVNNGLDGDGPYCTNRSGSLVAADVVELCFSGKYTKQQMHAMINGQGGLAAYLGESDCRLIEERAKTDAYAKLIYDGMIYQTCKLAGAMAAVLKGNVDAVVVTGGIAHSEYVVGQIQEQLRFIAPVALFPGENEMESLAMGSLEALRDPSVLKQM